MASEWQCIDHQSRTRRLELERGNQATQQRDRLYQSWRDSISQIKYFMPKIEHYVRAFLDSACLRIDFTYFLLLSLCDSSAGFDNKRLQNRFKKFVTFSR